MREADVCSGGMLSLAGHTVRTDALQPILFCLFRESEFIDVITYRSCPATKKHEKFCEAGPEMLVGAIEPAEGSPESLQGRLW